MNLRSPVKRLPALFRMRNKQAGLPPGTLVHVGERRLEKVVVTTTVYDEKTIDESVSVGALPPESEATGVSWIDIDGIHDEDVIRELGIRHDLTALVLEDIMNTSQGPKVEMVDGKLFFVLKAFHVHQNEHFLLETEQVSLILGKNMVLSLQEQDEDAFLPVRERLRRGSGAIRKRGADYLAYAIIDTIVDGYFLALGSLGEAMEEVEDDLMADPSSKTLHSIYHLKRNLVQIRHAVWPLREIIGKLDRREFALIEKSTGPYIRDLYDHVLQILSMADVYREMLTGMQDIYLSAASNRMNDVMKILTIISTIFIPLSFIVGLYGMNFRYMPELEWKAGYFGVWGVILLIAGGMLLFFKKKKWL